MQLRYFCTFILCSIFRMQINKTNFCFSARILLAMEKNLEAQWTWTCLMSTFIILMRMNHQLSLTLERGQWEETIPRPIVHEQLEAKEEVDQKALDLDRRGDRPNKVVFPSVISTLQCKHILVNILSNQK